MDFETVSPEDFGAGLRGLGLNLLVRDVREACILCENGYARGGLAPAGR